MRCQSFSGQHSHVHTKGQPNTQHAKNWRTQSKAIWTQNYNKPSSGLNLVTWKMWGNTSTHCAIMLLICSESLRSFLLIFLLKTGMLIYYMDHLLLWWIVSSYIECTVYTQGLSGNSECRCYIASYPFGHNRVGGQRSPMCTLSQTSLVALAIRGPPQALNLRAVVHHALQQAPVFPPSLW